LMIRPRFARVFSATPAFARTRQESGMGNTMPRAQKKAEAAESRFGPG